MIVDNRFIRWRCRERNCPDAALAKANHQVAYHMADFYSSMQWTEYESAPNKE